MDRVVFSADKSTWQTPDNVLDLVRAVSPIALDPCSAPDNPTRAKVICIAPDDPAPLPQVVDYTIYRDGLKTPWELITKPSDGLIFVNWPYGKTGGEWSSRCVAAARLGYEIIALPAARTDIKWWHRDVVTADAICFWKGRIKFKGGAHCAPFPSALPYWGPQVDKFCKIFAPRGHVVRAARIKVARDG